MKNVFLIILICIVNTANAQYFNIENALMNSIYFKNSSANSIYNSIPKKIENIETINKQLDLIKEDSFTVSEDIVNLYVLKALSHINTGNLKTNLLNALYAKRVAIKCKNEAAINNSSLILALINFKLNAYKISIEDIKQCNFANSVLKYEVEYIKALCYQNIQDYTASNKILITLMPLSKNISPFDHIKCLSFYISNASQNNDTDLAIKYALKLDTLLNELTLRNQY